MLNRIKTVKDADVSDKIVLMRADLNLPIVHGKITDLTRLIKIIPTIQCLIAKGAKVVLISHYGNPQGKFLVDMSLSPIVDKLSEALGGVPVKFGVDVLSKSTRDKINKMKSGEVMLLENIRFHLGEEQNDQEFAKKVAEIGQFYVNDAFSCSHRHHASIVSLPKFLPSSPGLLLIEELENLQKYLVNPKKKIMAITGGAKVSLKINLLHSLIEQADYLVIGGAMANTFLKANGHNVGKSLYEPNHISTALSITQKAEQLGCSIILPTDMITAKALAHNISYKVKSSSRVEDDEMILDVGPKFLAEIIFKLDEVATVIWNGPLGAFEHAPFDLGTTTIARAIASATSNNNLISIAGGGDVVSAINNAGLGESFTYISTGGGAFLEWLENKTLPGIEALITVTTTTGNANRPLQAL